MHDKYFETTLTNKMACKTFLTSLEKERPEIRWQTGGKPTDFIPPLNRYPLCIRLDSYTKRIYFRPISYSIH